MPGISSISCPFAEISLIFYASVRLPKAVKKRVKYLKILDHELGVAIALACETHESANLFLNATLRFRH